MRKPLVYTKKIIIDSHKIKKQLTEKSTNLNGTALKYINSSSFDISILKIDFELIYRVWWWWWWLWCVCVCKVGP